MPGKPERQAALFGPVPKENQPRAQNQKPNNMTEKTKEEIEETITEVENRLLVINKVLGEHRRGQVFFQPFYHQITGDLAELREVMNLLYIIAKKREEG